MGGRPNSKQKPTNKTSVALRVPESARSLKDMTGSDENQFSQVVLNQAIGAIWMGENCSEEARNSLYLAGLTAMKAIAPRNEIEGMLAAQMVAVHFAAMDCYRRAAIPNQTFEGRDMALRHGEKLSRVYNEQMEALRRLRGKGQQKVTVRHVHVHEGGQAIVGNVASGGRGAGGNRGPTS